jgi:hypothetical protein
MDFQYNKCELVRLRDLGLDEKWLQDKIEEDPSLLGLGDLIVVQRERKQSTGSNSSRSFHRSCISSADRNPEVTSIKTIAKSRFPLTVVFFFNQANNRFTSATERAFLVRLPFFVLFSFRCKFSDITFP